MRDRPTFIHQAVRWCGPLFLILMLAAPAGSLAAPPHGRETAPGRQPLGPRQIPVVYPISRAEATQDVLWGTAVKDPFRWLEDANSPEVKEWMEAEDTLTRDYLASLPRVKPLQDRYRRVFAINSVSIPAVRGNRQFYTRRFAGKDKIILYWRDGDNGEEHVLIDPNGDAFGRNNALGGWSPSWDGKLLAYQFKPNNADEAILRLIEVDTGQDHDIDAIDGGKYAGAVWTRDNKGFYYTWLPTDPSIPADERPAYQEVRYHVVGTPPSRDEVTYPKLGDPTTFVGPDLSYDGRWLFIYIWYGWTGGEVFYKDLWADGDPFHALYKSETDYIYVAVWKDNAYIYGVEGTPRGQMYKVSMTDPRQANWQVIVPQGGPSEVLYNYGIVGDRLLLQWTKDAVGRLEVRDLEGRPVRDVQVPGVGTITGFAGDPDRDTLYFTFSSYINPTTVYESSAAAGTTKVWFKVAYPVDPDPYVAEQVFYHSKDGTQVPLFIVRRRDAPRDGNQPVLLYGYGGFCINAEPSFWSAIYPWLEAGGTYAEAAIRGGCEYGEEWHRAGMTTNKQNVFDDFIAAAEYLVRENYTRPDRLAIWGGSNGGLLVGAALTQRPDLFGAVICEVPLLDMVRYHLFGSGRTWTSEYGSAEDEIQFRALYAYSPYHHVVSATHYPAVLFMSADADDRVDPMHARKMAAALQVASPGGKPVLLRIERHAGHGGSGLVSDSVKYYADLMAFLMDQLQLTGRLPGELTLYLPMTLRNGQPEGIRAAGTH